MVLSDLLLYSLQKRPLSSQPQSHTVHPSVCFLRGGRVLNRTEYNSGEYNIYEIRFVIERDQSLKCLYNIGKSRTKGTMLSVFKPSFTLNV